MKARNNNLIKIAQKALSKNKEIWKNEEKGEILESYDGQIAALGVTIASSGLLPALAIYFADHKDNKDKKSKGTKAYKRNVLEVIAIMISEDKKDYFDNKTGKSLSEKLLKKALVSNIDDLKALSKEIIECAVALKFIVRTYNLVKDEK
ncbi:hypothetical protein FACS189414_1050 [Bacteroidia bacterium]|nr:hypothetical protein FACS189414_1050 [Bacteroidia bacterium]